jgi:hypothetical protein
MYNGIELVDIPSGMGGHFPAAIANDEGDTLKVICLHPDYYNNWVLQVKRSQVKPFSYRLTDDMKKIIDERFVNEPP